jgi:hypothetical protein
MNSCFATLKKELVQRGHYKTREQAWQSLCDDIEAFHHRVQNSLPAATITGIPKAGVTVR